MVDDERRVDAVDFNEVSYQLRGTRKGINVAVHVQCILRNIWNIFRCTVKTALGKKLQSNKSILPSKMTENKEKIEKENKKNSCFVSDIFFSTWIN